MKKTLSLLAKTKQFIANHLSLVLIASGAAIVCISIMAVVIIANNQPQETSRQTDNVAQEYDEQEDNHSTEDLEDATDSDDADDKSDSATQAQNEASHQPQPVEKPSSSVASNNSSSSNSSQSATSTTPATPSTPSPSETPTTPTQPQEPAKTEYFYVCVGNISDPAIKAQMLEEFPGAEDNITLTMNGPYKLTDCWDNLKNSTMVDPNYLRYFTWQLIECGSYEEMNSYLKH